MLIVLAALDALAQTTDAGQQLRNSHLLAPPTMNVSRASSPMDAGPLNFLPAVSYNSGGYLASVAVADVNGDGKLDVLVANYQTDHGFCCSSDVDVLLGNGDGTFQAAVYYDTGGQALSVAVADVNSDGKPDLLVANNGGSVGVLLGNGDGTFQPAVTYSSGGPQTDSLAVADVNGDGKPDLLVANYGSGPGSVGVLLGNGDGTFQPVVTYNSGGPGAISLTVVDLNGDGKPDLVVANINTIGVLLGNGDGTFQPAVTYNSGGSGQFGTQVVSGDVNGDGKPDLLVAVTFSNGSGAAGVLLGNGDGTFRPEVTYGSGGGGTNAIAVADLNGDGKLDLAMANAYTNDVGVLLGNGDGTFKTVVTYDSGNGDGVVNGGSPVSMAVGDVNGDGQPDLLVGSQYAQLVGVLLNNYGASPTTTSLVSSANPAAFTQTVTYTAIVAGKLGRTLAGTVTFRDGSTPIATVTLTNNQAVYSTSYPRKIATHTINAAYSGALHHDAGSRSATLTEYISAPSRIALVSSGSPSFVGQPVMFMATVTSRFGQIPDGELVTFYDGTTALGSVPLASEKATFTTSKLSGGKTHGMRAVYVGDTTISSSTGFLAQVVDLYSSTTVLSSHPNPSTFGQTVTIIATVKSSGPDTPTGRVVFKDGTSWIGAATLSGGVAKLIKSRLAVGTHPMTAEYLGDAISAKSLTAVLNQVVK
jgi:hypothetical protein